MTDFSVGSAGQGVGALTGAPVDDLDGKRFEPFDAVRMVLGILLLAAAALKGYELATSPVLETSLFGSRWTRIVLVELELLLGLWLLSGLFVHAMWWVLVVCFSVFTSVTLYQALGGAESCGCFGKVQINPWYTFILDAGAVLALLVFLPGNRRMPVRYPRMRLAGVFLVAAMVGIPGGIAMAMYSPPTLDSEGLVAAEDGTVVLDVANWVDQRFPLSRFIEIEDNLMRGQWAVVLYRHDCPACRRALPRYEEIARRWAAQSHGRRLALVELAPYASSHNHRDPVSDDTAMVRGRLIDQYDWFVQVPTSLDVENGMVTAVPSRSLSQGASE